MRLRAGQKRIGLAAGALLTLGIAWAGAHLGLEVRSARVSRPNNPQSPPDVALYRLASGDYLLRLREVSARGGDRTEFPTWYALRPRENEVLFAHSGGRFVFAPGIVLNADIRPGNVALGPGKAGGPRPAVCRVGHFEFQTMVSREPIRVAW